MLELDPNFGISAWVVCSGQRRAQLYLDVLRKAGLPDNDRVAFRALSTVSPSVALLKPRPTARFSADVAQRDRHVRFVPEAVLPNGQHQSKMPGSFD